MQVIEILEELERTSSKLAKQAILEKHKDNELLKKVLRASLDPYVDYGVKKFSKPKFGDIDGSDLVLMNYLEFLNDLADRTLSGNAAREALTDTFSGMDEQAQKWLERILLKNLRAGVDTTVNKVWPGLIPSFEVARAETLETTQVKGEGMKITGKVKYPVRVDPKFDGLRCIAVKSNGVVTLFKRSGDVLDTLPKIQEALTKAPYDNYVLDGEGLSGEGAGSWNDSSSIMMAKKTKKDDSSMVFYVFDALPILDWTDQNSTQPYSERIKAFEKIISEMPSTAPVKVVQGKVVNNDSELLEYYQETLKSGYEGVMVKDLSSKYLFKKSKAILKLKPVQTFEGVIVGFYEGSKATRLEGKFGGFEVVLPNGVVTRVGGGYTDKLREDIWTDPAAFIGQVLEIEGQPEPGTADGLTKDGAIRFPVMTRFRDEKDVDKTVLEAGRKYLVK